MVNGNGRRKLDKGEIAILSLFGGELKHLLEESHITQIRFVYYYSFSYF